MSHPANRHGGNRGMGGRFDSRIPTMNENGIIMSKAERDRYCYKRGLCSRCGQKTHELSGPFHKRKGITDENVLDGTCLLCNPNLRPTGYKNAPSAKPSSAYRAGTGSREVRSTQRSPPRHKLSDDGMSGNGSRSWRGESRGVSGSQSQEKDSYEVEMDQKYGWKCSALEKPNSSTIRNSSVDVDADIWDIIGELRKQADDPQKVSRRLHQLIVMGVNEAGVLAQIHEVMNAHPRDSRLLASAAGAVWSVTSQDDDSKANVVDEGCAEQIIRALRENLAHDADTRLQVWGLGVLQSIIPALGNRAEITDAGVLDVISAALPLTLDPGNPRYPRSSSDGAAIFQWSACLLQNLVDTEELTSLSGDSFMRANAMTVEEEVEKAKEIAQKLRNNVKITNDLLAAMCAHTGNIAAQHMSFRFLWLLLIAAEVDNDGEYEEYTLAGVSNDDRLATKMREGTAVGASFVRSSNPDDRLIAKMRGEAAGGASLVRFSNPDDRLAAKMRGEAAVGASSTRGSSNDDVGASSVRRSFNPDDRLAAKMRGEAAGGASSFRSSYNPGNRMAAKMRGMTAKGASFIRSSNPDDRLAAKMRGEAAVGASSVSASTPDDRLATKMRGETAVGASFVRSSNPDDRLAAKMRGEAAVGASSPRSSNPDDRLAAKMRGETAVGASFVRSSNPDDRLVAKMRGEAAVGASSIRRSSNPDDRLAAKMRGEAAMGASSTRRSSNDDDRLAQKMKGGTVGVKSTPHSISLDGQMAGGKKSVAFSDHGEGMERKMFWRTPEEVSQYSFSFLKEIRNAGGTHICCEIIRSRFYGSRLDHMALAMLRAIAEVDQEVGIFSSVKKAVGFKVVEGIVQIMDESSDNAVVQDDALALLVEWAAEGSDDRKTELCRAGAINAVLSALENHGTAVTQIRTLACHILWMLSSCNDIWRDNGAKNMLDKVIRALIHILELEKVQPENYSSAYGLSLGALSNFSIFFGGSGASAGTLAGVGLSVIIVSDALTRGLADLDPVLAEGACWAQANLCHADPNLADNIFDSGGVDMMVKVLKSDDLVAIESLSLAAIEAISAVLSSSNDSYRAAIVDANGIEAIVGAMERHPLSMSVQSCASYALGCLILCHSSESSVVREKVADVLIEALKLHPDSPNVLIRGCLALRNLAVAAAGTGRSRRIKALPNVAVALQVVLDILDQGKSMDMMLESEVLGAICALSAHFLYDDAPGDSIPMTVAEKAFRSLLRLIDKHIGGRGFSRSCNAPLLAEALEALGNISAAAYVSGGADRPMIMTIKPTSAEVELILTVVYEAKRQGVSHLTEITEACFGVLLNLRNDPETESIIIVAGGIIGIVDTMLANKTSEGISTAGCRLLGAMSEARFEVKIAIAESDGIEAIVQAMQHFPNSPNVLIPACKTLADLAHDEEARSFILRQGGLAAALGVLRDNRENDILQERAMEVLSQLTIEAQDNVIAEADIVKDTVDTIRYSPKRPRILELCLMLLQNLSNQHPRLKVAIVSADGIKHIVFALKENLLSSEAVEAALITLWSLSTNPSNQRKIIVANGINTIIIAMMANLSFVEIQKLACRCLCTLSTNPECRQIMLKFDAFDAIVFSIWAHLDKESYLMEACRTLATLTKDSGGVPIRPDVLNATMLSMRHFPNSPQLLEIACLAIRNFFRSQANLPLLYDAAEDLSLLLQCAASSFPNSCGKRADEVLTLLYGE